MNYGKESQSILANNIFEYMKKNDEFIFNFFLLISSTMLIRYMDHNITCKRPNYVEQNIFSSISNEWNDFFSATYGFDTQCLEWRSLFQTIALCLTTMSLIFFTNHLEDTLEKKYKTLSSIAFAQLKTMAIAPCRALPVGVGKAPLVVGAGDTLNPSI